MPSSGGKEFSTRLMGKRQPAIYIHALSLKEKKKGVVKKRESGKRANNVCLHQKQGDIL